MIAAVQDPGKDVIGFRDLFPTRIALRLLEDVQVDMVLGRSARLHGAQCDLIPPSLPGVGYVIARRHPRTHPRPRRLRLRRRPGRKWSTPTAHPHVEPVAELTDRRSA